MMMKDENTENCYWWQDAPPQSAPSSPWQDRADIVVVGCGYTGLTAALFLARAGRQVIILEKGLIGEGASTRNGGITSGNIRFSETELARRFGPDKARAFSDEAVAARNDFTDFIGREKLACDYQPAGRIVGIDGRINEEALRRDRKTYKSRYNIESALLKGADLAEHIVSEKYIAGIWRPDIGGIHPAKLLHELVRLVQEEKVIIYSQTPVRGIVRTGTSFRVETKWGPVMASHVIGATNGYTDQALPWLRRRLIPVVSEMIATEKLGSEQVRALMPGLNMFGEARQLGYYYRPSPDQQRILLGGRRMDKNPKKAKSRLHQALIGIFPDLGAVNIEYYWRGNVVFPFDQIPKLAIHDGIIYPTGFCGSGTIWAYWLGQKAALMILGEEGNSVFANMVMRSMPLYTGRPWFLPLSMVYFRLRDRLM